MEDKYVQEAINILKVSTTNPLIKDSKKLAKIKIEIMKSLLEQGIHIPIA